MKIRNHLTAFIIFSSFLCLSALGQGALTPPGAPAPTMKSLAQIEPRTPISSAPFTISASGSYYLTTNLITSVSNAIVITAGGVTLDLNGFSIGSLVANAANGGSAILLSSSSGDITIFNGHIRSGVNNSGGVYSGSGFAFGINFSPGFLQKNIRIAGVSVTGCLNHGIYLALDSSVVESCTVRTVGLNGIYASAVKNCIALDCGDTAIFGNQVSDSRGQSAGGYGLYAVTAENCYGVSTSQIGLYADGNAINCYGNSTTGTGLYATSATSCIGERAGGRAIQATIANGCLARSGTNLIMYKYNMP
ncbi:MAG: hypothetical protein WDN00_06055 [Limisphaerales bacterium]